MPHTYKTCHEAFERGLEDRKAYTLSSGARRLRESLDGPQRISETLRNIAADIRCKGHGYSRLFGSCTSDDAAVWLKRRPQNIAYDLGYNVVPAIKALARDGVPADAVSRCLASASSVIPAILDDCEAARINLSHRIRTEYTRMKAGQSTVQPLVDAEKALISATLTAVKPWI
jgi:hypothetical protein